MTQAYCKIIQVWEKQGFGRTRQITWKSLKHSYLTLLPTWFSILMWKAIFLSLEIKLGLVQIQRILFHWYLSIFTCLRFLHFGLTSRSVFLNLGISIYMDFQMYWAVLKVCTAMRLHPHTCAKLCDSLLHRNVWGSYLWRFWKLLLWKNLWVSLSILVLYDKNQTWKNQMEFLLQCESAAGKDQERVFHHNHV